MTEEGATELIRGPSPGNIQMLDTHIQALWCTQYEVGCMQVYQTDVDRATVD